MTMAVMMMIRIIGIVIMFESAKAMVNFNIRRAEVEKHIGHSIGYFTSENWLELALQSQPETQGLIPGDPQYLRLQDEMNMCLEAAVLVEELEKMKERLE